MSYIFTSESVSGGHPDKVCDQISDAVLDAYLAEDPNSRVACETMIKNNMVFIAGEITSLGSPDLEPVVRKTINDIGYNTDEYGFNGDTCEFTNLVFEQSPDISQGVDVVEELVRIKGYDQIKMIEPKKVRKKETLNNYFSSK